MSVSGVDGSQSAAWTIHRYNPTPPSQPPNWSQFDSTAASTATAGTASTTSGSGQTRIGADLNTLLLDLQANGTGSGTATQEAGSTTDSTSATSSASNGLANDLSTFLNDLTASAGTTQPGTAGQSGGAARAGHHHHHGPPPPADAGDSQPDTVSAAVAKALKTYGGGAQDTSTIALSA